MRTAALLSGVLMIVSCCSQLNEALRILVISPFNSRSHDGMSDRLAKALAAKGHRIDAYTHFPPKKRIPNYEHHSLEGTLPVFTNNLNFSTTMQFQGGNHRQTFKKIGEPVCGLMGLPVFEQLLNNPPRDPPYDLVIVQSFITDCYLAWGRHLKVPLIGMSALSTLDWYNEALGNPSSSAVSPGFATDLYPPMDFWQRLYNTVWTSVRLHMLAHTFEAQHRYVERFFGGGYPSIADLRRDLDLLMVNSHYALDGVKAYTPAVVPVAGIHIAEDDNSTKLPVQVQQWLDDSKHGCVYFTFGSMVRIESFPRPLLDAFYTAFKQLAPVRVLMKVAHPQDLPPGLPPNVITRSWFSQVLVFKHNNVKAFITHGGLMSTIEAINARIPMVGIPLFGDQPQNVKMNVKRGVATAVQLDSITADKLTQAIKDVLYKPSYKENMDKLSAKFVDRPMKPIDTAIYWVEYVARHGKKCLRSPLVDMPWWQAQLLDVYAFLLSALLLIYYLLQFLIKKIWNMCCANKNQSQLESKKTR